MPCYTVNQVLRMKELVTNSRNWLDELRKPGSRLYELQAYAFLVNLIPTGIVPSDEAAIGLTITRFNELVEVLQILDQSFEEIDGNAGGGGSGEIPTDPVEAECDDLISILTDINNNLDIEAKIRIIFNEYLPKIVDALNPSFVSTNNNIITLNNNVITNAEDNTTEILLRIQDTRSELREARERLIEIQSNNKDLEILQRIEDTRIELREARERLIRVEECVCPRIEPREETEIDIDDLVNRIENRIGLLLDAKLNDLYLRLGDFIRLQLEGAISSIRNYIDNPSWLGNLQAQINNINNSLIKLDQLINLLTALQSYLNQQFSLLKADVDLVKNIAENIDTNVSLVYDIVSQLRDRITDLDQIITLIDRSREQEANNARTTHALLGTALITLGIIDDKLDDLNPLLEGSIIAQRCNETQLLPFSGRGLFGVRDQLSALSIQLNLIHQDYCLAQQQQTEEFNGVIQSYNCESETTIDLPFSGNGNQLLINGFQTLSQALLPVQREVCDLSGECFVMAPTDVQEELVLERQLILHWRVDNNQKLKQVSRWTSKIDNPIDDLDWCMHLDQIRWTGGNITIRQYFVGTETRLGGYFLDEQSGLETVEQLISLTKMQRRTPVPRITKNGSTFIESEGVVRRIYKAVIADIVDGKPIPVICLKPPIGGCQ